MQDGTQNSNPLPATPVSAPALLGVAETLLSNDQVTEEIAAMGRAGWRTTEFWFAALTLVSIVLCLCANMIPARDAEVISGAVSLGYAALRTLNKNSVARSHALANQPVLEAGAPSPVAPQPPVAATAPSTPRIGTPGDLVPLLTLAAALLFLSGCTQFRRDVSAVGVQGGGTVSAAGDSEFNGGVTLSLRDPDGLAK